MRITAEYLAKFDYGKLPKWLRVKCIQALRRAPEAGKMMALGSCKEGEIIDFDDQCDICGKWFLKGSMKFDVIAHIYYGDVDCR